MKNAIKFGIIGLAIGMTVFAIKEEIEYRNEVKRFNEHVNRMNEIKEKMAKIGL